MKKLYYVAMLAIAISSCFTGCRRASGHGAMDSIAYDSVMDSNIECKINIAYPTGDDSLTLSIQRFIASELASLYLPRNNSDEESEANKYPVYSGSLADGQQLVDYYGNGVMTYLAEMREEWKEYAAEGTPMPTLSQKITIAVKDVTPQFITYSIIDDNYLGGAHHSYTSYCRNISLETGKPMDNILNAGKLRDMQPVLRKNILSCLQTCGVEDVVDSTMENYLILPDDGLVPLPAHLPWIENDSLHFIYQQYEIASYAVGQIDFKVAMKDIKPYLTKGAEEILK